MQNDRARTLPFFVTLRFASVLQPTVLYRHHPGRPVEHRGYTSSVEQVKPSNKILQRRGFLSERPLLHELLVLLPSQFLLERTSESDGYERGIDHFVRVVETNGKQGSRGGRLGFSDEVRGLEIGEERSGEGLEVGDAEQAEVPRPMRFGMHESKQRGGKEQGKRDQRRCRSGRARREKRDGLWTGSDSSDCSDERDENVG